MKNNVKIIHIGSEPELLPVETGVQKWLNFKGKYSDIPFEDNIFWETKRVTDYYLSTLSIFCPEKVCSNKSTEGWLFHDRTHLSEIGAKNLLPELTPLIREILSMNP